LPIRYGSAAAEVKPDVPVSMVERNYGRDPEPCPILSQPESMVPERKADWNQSL